MFREAMPIVYDAPAELKKWPSLGNQRLNGGRQPYLSASRCMNVRFTRKAQADLDQLRSFISQENQAAASRLVTRLLELSWALADNPKEGRKTDEPGVHVLIVARLNYLLFY